MRVLIMSVMLAGGSGLAACGGPAADSPEDTVPAIEESDLQGARDAAAKLGSELKAQLIAAIEAEGPVGGVQVCAQIAPDIAKMVSEDTGFEVGRTSLRTRNASNMPDGWERETLLAFDEAMRHGKTADSLERAEVVSEDGVQTLRWMKPIPTGQLCLACHGEHVDDAVLAEIAAQYPGDQATGFQPGEMRGAFTVSKVMSAWG